MSQQTPINTATGQPIWYRTPDRTRVFPADLRTHLERLCRYTGARPWTVLQHSALCTLQARVLDPDDTALHAYAAAHDLHEAYLGDATTGLKEVLPLAEKGGGAMKCRCRARARITVRAESIPGAWSDYESRKLVQCLRWHNEEEVGAFGFHDGGVVVVKGRRLRVLWSDDQVTETAKIDGRTTTIATIDASRAWRLA